MVRTIDANQVKKLDRPYIQPIYLVHLLLDGVTLYLSDRNYTYNGHNYEDYLYDLTDLGNRLSLEGGYLGGLENSNVTLRFKNSRFRTKTYLINYFDDYPVEKRYVEIYKLCVDSESEVFGSDVSTKMFKGEMSQPTSASNTEFIVQCNTMLFGKMGKLPLQLIKQADFPYADPDDIGTYRNIVYGSLKKIYCPWTIAGWLSTLTADISTGSPLTISVSQPLYAVPSSGYVKCDNEDMAVSSVDIPNRTVTVTRSAPVTHKKGARIYEKRTDFTAEVAQHAVKSIGDIYVKRGTGSSDWLRVVSGATKYLTAPARIVFSDKVVLEEGKASTLGLNDPTHGHTASQVVSTKTCVPSSSTPNNPAAYDGNESSNNPGVVNVNYTFTDPNIGTIVRQWIHLCFPGSGQTGNITVGGQLTTPPQCGPGGYMPAGSVWKYRVYRNGGSWSDAVAVINGAAGQTNEIWKEVEYYATPTINPNASGDSLTGANSVANMMVGDMVCCDVEGYADLDGNYGGAGTLIERPDWVRKHNLVQLLNFALADVDSTSFAAAGTNYGATYKFGFVMDQVATDTMEYFNQLDLQSRSSLFEQGGKFYLNFNVIPLSYPASNFTFNSDNLVKLPVYNKTEVADIKNKIWARYFMDFSKPKGSSPEELYQKVKEVSNAASITKYGEIFEELNFSAVGDQDAMVTDALAWILYQKRDVVRTVELQCYWDATKLQYLDYFIISDSFWYEVSPGVERKWKITKAIENPREQTIDIEAIEVVLGP